MVETDEFIYGHIPYTGGDAVHQYFSSIKEILPDKIISIDSLRVHEKHDPFGRRQKSDKKLVLSIRKLPSYMLAFINRLTKGMYPSWQSAPHPSIDDIINIKSEYGNKHIEYVTGPLATVPDRYLAYFTSNFKYKVHHFLRTEHLKQDIADLMNININSFDAETKSSNSYDHTIPWEQDVIDKIYENNPLWAEIERSFKVTHPNS